MPHYIYVSICKRCFSCYESKFRGDFNNIDRGISIGYILHQNILPKQLPKMNPMLSFFYAVFVMTSATLAFSPLAPTTLNRPHAFMSRSQNPSFTYKSSQIRLAGDDSEERKKEKLNQLGFSDDRRVQDVPDSVDDVNVRVDIIDNVDPVTITALGFAAIAANFLIFANMGDGGIGGLVARIINFFR